MTKRQIRAIFVVAVVISIAGLISVIINTREHASQKFPVGMVEPEILIGDTVSATPHKKKVRSVSGKKSVKKTVKDSVIFSDTPLRHETARSDIQEVEK